MGATYAYNSTYFDSSGNVKPTAHKPPIGLGAVGDVVTVATTSLDDVGDVLALVPVPSGKTILSIAWTSTDMDTGSAALDADLVLRTTDKAGSHTDTTLVDTSALASTYFGAAAQARYQPLSPTVVPDDADGYGNVCLKVGTAAATAAQGTLGIYVTYI